MRRFILAAALICAGFSATPAFAETGLSGRWTGRYYCPAKDDTTLVLEVNDAGNSTVEGTFSFVLGNQKGSYSVSGRLQPNGSFSLNPMAWIDRPVGFNAQAIKGALNPSGRLIEGTLSISGCSGRFTATREAAEAGNLAADGGGAPAALASNPYQGHWQGDVRCTMNRRGKTEAYPLAMDIFADGRGIGALVSLKVYRKLGSGAGPAFDQLYLLSGTSGDAGARLGDRLVISDGGGRAALRELEIASGPGERMAGTAALNGCGNMSLVRAGEARHAPFAPELAGPWAGVAGDTQFSLHIVGEAAPPFAELQASYPVDREDASRDRLRLTLVPVLERSGRLLLVPVGAREASGVFSGTGTRVHFAASSRAFTVAVAAGGRLELRGIGHDRDVAAALAGQASRGGQQRTYLLTRRSADEQQALGQGQTLPLAFDVMGGSLAQGASREQQCQALEEWLRPYAGAVDLRRMGIDVALRDMGAAFSDDVFERVFGVPLLQIPPGERVALARMMSDTCGRSMGMELVAFVGNFAFRTDSGFERLNAILVNKREAATWYQDTLAGLDAVPSDASGLDRLQSLRRELSLRSPDLSQSESRDFLDRLSDREADITTEIFLAEARALPETGFDDGALDRVFGLARRLDASQLDSARKTGVMQIAREKSAAILNDPIIEAIGVGQSVPTSLDGLRQAMGALNRFGPIRAAMEQYFGTIDREGRLGPLYLRVEELQADPEILQGLRAELLSVAPGADPKQAVLQAASQYVDVSNGIRSPEIAAIVEEATLRAEVAAVRITDNSVAASKDEPTAEDIAAFALQRVREANQQISAAEDACMSGRITDPIMAIGCLKQPGLWTGQKGFGARLLAVEKIGCREKVAGIEYECSFTQQIDINMPGGDAFGGSSLSAMAKDLSRNEVAESLFRRTKGGGWSVVTRHSD